MPKFSLPSDLRPDDMTKTYAAMTDWLGGNGDKTAPFVVQSAGAAMIATSLSLSMASHMTGVMLGMFEGMMSVSMKAAQANGRGLLASTAQSSSERGLSDRISEAASEKVGKTPAEVSAKGSNVVSLDNARIIGMSEKPKNKSAKQSGPKSGPKSGKSSGNSVDETAAIAKTAPESVIAALEPEDFRRPAEIEKPAQADDLKMISGVGPKLEQVLNSLGIWSFDQVAAWSPNEIAWVDDYLQFSGRIERDDWIAQAAALAKGGRDEYMRVFGKEPR